MCDVTTGTSRALLNSLRPQSFWRSSSLVDMRNHCFCEIAMLVVRAESDSGSLSRSCPSYTSRPTGTLGCRTSCLSICFSRGPDHYRVGPHDNVDVEPKRRSGELV
jgi:hypothetical protein